MSVLPEACRICLVSLCQVSPASIITALIKDQFVSIAPNTVLPRVTVPSDTYGNLQSGHLTTIIVDTSRVFSRLARYAT